MSEVEVVVGRVGRPHGVRGSVQIELRTDEPERRFAPGAVLHLVRDVPAGPGPRPGRSSSGAVERGPGSGLPPGGRRLEVAAVRWHQARLLVDFGGVSDRTAAEGLRGGLLVTRVSATESPSGPAEYYDRQLVGLTVLDAAGLEVGRVVEVVHLPAQDLLAVQVLGADQPGPRLVPFVAALVPEVDLAAGHVRLADVEGLLSDVDG